jgi:hypothetical protein
MRTVRRFFAPAVALVCLLAGRTRLCAQRVHTARPFGYAFLALIAAAISAPSIAVAGSATHFSVSTPSSAIAGVAFSLTVTALDASNNTATSYEGTVHFTTTDGGSGTTLPADYTFTVGDAGVHTFTNGAVLITPPSQTITVTDTGNSSITGTSNTIAVTGFATHLSVSAPATATSGTAFSLTVTALDASNNTATGYEGTVHFTTTDGGSGTTLPADYTFTTGDAGVHTFTNGATLITPPSQNITATDTSTSITGSATIAVKAIPTTSVGTSGSPSVFGQTVTFTATVAPPFGGLPTPTGTVTFVIDNNVQTPSPTLNGSGQASFSIQFVSVGSHTVTVTYNGDSNYTTSSGSLNPNQAVIKANTNVSVSSSVNPSVYGQRVTFTATITAVAPGAGTPTGPVTFIDGLATLGPGTLINGVATFTTTSPTQLPTGGNNITVSYGGDTNFISSMGSLTNNPQVVNTANVTISVVSSSNPSAVNQPVTFTVNVTAVAPGSGTPTGTITLKDGANTLATPTLSGGVASFSTALLPLGNQSITASYPGDGNFIAGNGTLTGNPQDVTGPPTVTAVSPNAGPLGGGTSVTITGTNFNGSTAVNFGSTPAIPFVVNSPTQITATSPAGSLGTVDVTVTTPAGTSTTSAADQFIYTNGPSVSAVSPKGGPTTGGTVVTVSGANFLPATAVNFGLVPATTFTVNSAMQITATSPPEAAGSVDVTVVSPGGTSPTSAADQFTFSPPPVVTAVTPAFGTTLGGTIVTITGTGLAGATAINFGSTAATSFTVNSAASITTTAPTGIGSVDVTVTTPVGTSPTSSADKFGYEPSHDFNGDGKSDVLWRDTSNNIGMWLMNGASISQNKVLGAVLSTWAVVGQRDLSGDGKSGVLWRDTGGNLGIWLMNGTQIALNTVLGGVPTTWSVAATGDFNADGKGDIVWRDTSGNVYIWLMNGTSILQTINLGNVPTNWVIVGADMKGEIFWRNLSDGEVGIWVVNGNTIVKNVDFAGIPLSWTIAGLGDFDGNGSTDILWRDNLGNAGIWLMNGTSFMSGGVIGNMPLNWSIAETGDYLGNGKSDIFWTDTAGDVQIWFMNGTSISSSTPLGNVGTSWTVQSLSAD